MRKHGWQLPYHPLQACSICSVFLALGFAFYVFFVPFVPTKPFQYVVMGLYTPLVTCVFCLYVWCAATDPGDPGIFRCKKNLKVEGCREQILSKESKQEGSTKQLNVETTAQKQFEGSKDSVYTRGELHSKHESERLPCNSVPCLAVLLSWCGMSCMCNWCQSHEQSSEQQMDEEGMFYCSLCEVEVLKNSKHCRVCDKCVDGFDHHCRWINNCIGRKNYRRFFILMASALLLLILQWLIGILVLIFCFLERKHFSAEIISKLGSSFSLVPFVVVVASCTCLAMVATLPLAQLLFFHILLIKKGISTYDYIIALREQEQEQELEQHAIGEPQSPQMSQVSSFTGLSSASSFNAFHRGAWCTPPRLFLEDQFDVVPPETGTSMNHISKKMMAEEPVRKRNAGKVKISPWTLARLNAEEVSKAAAQAKKKSKILQPIVRREILLGHDTDGSIGSSSGRMVLWPDNRRQMNKIGRIPVDLPLEPLAKISDSATDSNVGDLVPETSTSLAPLQLEARSAFRPNMPMSSARVVASSPDSSLGSPDLHPFRISLSGAEEVQRLSSHSVSGTVAPKGIQLSRSTSDGYEASGGEDSDRIPSRIVHRSSNWASIALGAEHGQMEHDLKFTPSASLQSYMKSQ
ncbi:unnamed protein product [Musa acuminata subsp. malaccensis]|uniref:S-acyltransferase n=1 Tax=Musa acuminata subsp. malaccensis TaxID=214687 RepID=A0A8D7FET3_MUSAM|nr:unnamed protein product [Musa acuminata subsp. malaccensis]